MDLIITKSVSEVVISIAGDLDTTNSIKLESTLSPLMQERILRLVLDCSELNYVCSFGLRIFLTLSKHMSSSGGDMVILHPNARVLEVIMMTGLNHIFKIER